MGNIFSCFFYVVFCGLMLSVVTQEIFASSIDIKAGEYCEVCAGYSKICTGPSSSPSGECPYVMHCQDDPDKRCGHTCEKNEGYYCSGGSFDYDQPGRLGQFFCPLGFKTNIAGATKSSDCCYSGTATKGYYITTDPSNMDFEEVLCENGYYCPGGSVTLCDDGNLVGGTIYVGREKCPDPEGTTISGEYKRGWSYANGTGWKTYSDCKEKFLPGGCNTYAYKNATLASAGSQVVVWGGTPYIASGETKNAIANHYVDSTSVTAACSPCPSGTGFQYISPNGTTGGEGSCKITCSAGYHVATVRGACVKCTGHTYTDSSNVVSAPNTSECTACPSLTTDWESATAAGASAKTLCKQTRTPINCASGKITQAATADGTWGSSSVTTSLSANSGYYVNGKSCTVCPIGYYCEGGTKDKAKCLAGTYQDKTGQSFCKSCPKDYSESDAGATNISECYVTVSAGYYISQNDGTKSGCETGYKCPGGKIYYKKTGDKTACNNGYYQDSEKQSSCKECDGGTYSANSGAYTTCNKCPAGTAHNLTKQTSCPECAAGTYASGTGNESCTQCDYGKYQDAAGQASCKDCAAGKYQDEKGKNSCKNCAAGSYTNTAGNKSCTPCAAGKYQDKKGQTSCTDCEAGTANNSTGQESCPACAAGTYASGTGNKSCSDCEAGTYSGTKAAKCTDCEAGTYSVAKAAECTLCELGTYQNQKKQSSCKNCAGGASTSSMGSKAYTDCRLTGSTEFCDSKGCFTLPFFDSLNVYQRNE